MLSNIRIVHWHYQDTEIDGADKPNLKMAVGNLTDNGYWIRWNYKLMNGEYGALECIIEETINKGSFPNDAEKAMRVVNKSFENFRKVFREKTKLLKLDVLVSDFEQTPLD